MQQQPILVTGTHRSGSTWFGRMLALSDEVGVVHEPFNPINTTSWFGDTPPHWYEHIAIGANSEHLGDMKRLVELRYPFATMLRRARTPRNVAAIARDGGQALLWRRQGRRLLMKDPIAFFSTPWLAENFDMAPVVTVRHPAAFVSSLKRLDWQFQFSNWTSQPALMSGPLAGHAELVERLAASSPSVIEQGIAVWRIMNDIVHRDYAARLGWQVLRYEDFAADPAGRFPRLYRDLGLTWTNAASTKLDTFTNAGSAEVAAGKHMSVRRNSEAAMWTWLERLTGDEVRQIREGTADVAQHFYSDADWTRNV